MFGTDLLLGCLKSEQGSKKAEDYESLLEENTQPAVRAVSWGVFRPAVHLLCSGSGTDLMQVSSSEFSSFVFSRCKQTQSTQAVLSLAVFTCAKFLQSDQNLQWSEILTPLFTWTLNKMIWSWHAFTHIKRLIRIINFDMDKKKKLYFHLCCKQKLLSLPNRCSPSHIHRLSSAHCSWKGNNKCIFLRRGSSWHIPCLSLLSCELYLLPWLGQRLSPWRTSCRGQR